MDAKFDCRVAQVPEQVWRDLNYDVGWEATRTGVVRCRSVHNKRTDIFGAIDGVNLRAIWCESWRASAFDLLQERQRLRHVEVRLPAAFGPDRLYLTAQISPDCGSIGTISGISLRGDEVFSGKLALLSHVVETRTREEDHRYETEIMLRGLRILLSSHTTSQKIEMLAALAVSAVRGAEYVVLEVQRDGRIQPFMGGAPATANGQALPVLCKLQQTPVSIHTEGGQHTAELRRLLGKSRRDVALILLPIASANIALLCTPKRENGFRPQDVGFVSRFALVLQQALALKDEQDKLVQAARLSALGQMSASLAHELRQPLNAISMVAQNLELMGERAPVPPGTLSAKVSRIREQVERASKIMDRIRRFSRRGTDPFAMVDIAQLVQGVRLLMEHDLLAAGIRLNIDAPNDLILRCDAIQIEQVLTNLVRNAMDALQGVGTAKKTDDGIITISIHQAESGIVLRVADNGPGFPEDVATRPLETFYTSKSGEAGTGLGLSICHMIAREHAGSLEVGNYGAGAFVELRLPTRSNVAQPDVHQAVS